MFKRLRKKTWTYGLAIIGGLILLGAAGMATYMHVALPDVRALNNVQMQIPLRIYTADGQLMAEYGAERRTPISLDKMPNQLIEAVLSTEDEDFYEHHGVDFLAILRAAHILIKTGKKTQGASTITMQVARNFFLNRKKTFSRKLNEILLALKIDAELSKDKILELYLNKIYFGQHAYGVAAAAQVYYGKQLDQLALPEMAMIAGMPRAPSRDNPITNPVAALRRRNHVLLRMYKRKLISDADYQQAINARVTAKYHGPRVGAKAPYVAELIREAMVHRFGSAAYTKGFEVYTTVNSRLQAAANRSLEHGLVQYQQRHGYLGPEAHWEIPADADLSVWTEKLQAMKTLNHLQLAVVVSVAPQAVEALLASGKTITIPWLGLAWARRQNADGSLGPSPTMASDIVSVGDVIRVKQSTENVWQLSQVPSVEGALVALNPNDGAIKALDGGFSFDESHFNRAIGAYRQPGSSFKPFIYSASLSKGFTLASMINDAPVVEADAGGEDQLWRPQNDTLKFYGATSLLTGLTRSRNLVSIRLLAAIGVPYAVTYASHFGFDPKRLPKGLSLVLGTGTVSPVMLARGYSVFANGGHLVKPYIISRIMTRSGKVVYKAAPDRVCSADSETCTHPAVRTITAQNAFLMDHALKEVIQKGTGHAALVLHRNDLAGKTGTSQNQKDAWFAGFNADIVTVIWVGYDEPTTLHEYGAQAALPIWIQFMKQALNKKTPHEMTRPAGIVSVRIDPKTGLLAGVNDPNATFELFRAGHQPKRVSHLKNISNGDGPLIDTIY